MLLSTLVFHVLLPGLVLSPRSAVPQDDLADLSPGHRPHSVCLWCYRQSKCLVGDVFEHIDAWSFSTSVGLFSRTNVDARNNCWTMEE
jgi:hypothetical protein